MAKRLCKMSRKQIAENLGQIHRLVVEPKFVCRSCARSSASEGALCKPAAIPPQQCQDKPLEQQQNCALLSEATPKADTKVVPNQDKAQAVRQVVERAKQKALQRQANIQVNRSKKSSELPFDLMQEKDIKLAKKALKKRYKQQKKLLKLAKKQQKLLKKHQRLEAKLNVAVTGSEITKTSSVASLH